MSRSGDDAIITAMYEGAFARPLNGFQDFLLDTVRPAIGFDSAVWITGVHHANQINSLWYHRRAPMNVPAYMTRFYQADTVRNAALATPGTAFRVEDTRALDDYYASDVYREIGRPGGMEQVMAVSVFSAITRLSHYIVLYGHDRARPFSDPARASLERLAPHMIAAWRHRQLAELLERPRAGEGDQDVRGRALADYRGVVEVAEDSFAETLARAFPAWRGPALPEPLRALLAGASDSARIAGLDVRLDRHDLCCLVTLSDPGPIATLTAAERRAAELFASGATQAQVAARLGLSQHTVRNQLATVYDKLGIHSKVALARHLPAAADPE